MGWWFAYGNRCLHRYIWHRRLQHLLSVMQSIIKRTRQLHLCGTLNSDAGDLAGKFASLYAFVIEQIGVANARRDIDVAQNCINILTTLKEGWEGLAAETQGTVPGAKTEVPENNAMLESGPICVQA